MLTHLLIMLDRMLQKVGDRMDETKHTEDKITESVTKDEMCKEGQDDLSENDRRQQSPYFGKSAFR